MTIDWSGRTVIGPAGRPPLELAARRYRDPVTLVDDLRRCADASGGPLARLDAGGDRFGPVAAILFGSGGYVSVRQRDHDGYTVLIWAGDELEAWGITPRLDDIVTTMRSWQAGHSVQALTEASPYLTTVDQQTAVDILWGLLSGNSDPHVSAIVTAAAAHPVLRAQRPWISHATPHLLHPGDPAGSTRRGLAFLPVDEARFTVLVYAGPTGPVQDAETAGATAAAAASAW